jgi:ABC-type phosphate transport system substrate-binding protein
MKLTIRVLSAAIALLILGSGLQLEAQDTGFVVIVNSANSINSASKSDVSKWFQKKVTKWADGSTIEPVDQGADSAVREEFSEVVHGKGVSAIKSYWQKRIFSGKGVPPAEAGSDAEVIAFVKSNSGAVGYVSASADLSGVKVVQLQ